MRRICILALTALLLTGCGGAGEEPAAVSATVPKMTVAQLVETEPEPTVPETTAPEVVDETVWLPPYYTDKGKLEFHCLVKNETMGNLSVESMHTAYYLNGEVVREKDYEKKSLKNFLWRPFNELDLSPAASTLLIVDDYPAKDGFDHALAAIRTVDEQGAETELLFNFTMDENQVTPSALTDDWELSTSWLVDEYDGWNWDHEVYNDTDDVLTLAYAHSIHYDNGIPVAAETSEPSQMG